MTDHGANVLEELREHGPPSKTIKLARTCSYPFQCNRVRESERHISFAGFHATGTQNGYDDHSNTLSAMYTIYFYLKQTPAATHPQLKYLQNPFARIYCAQYYSTQRVLCLLPF